MVLDSEIRVCQMVSRSQDIVAGKLDEVSKDNSTYFVSLMESTRILMGKVNDRQSSRNITHTVQKQHDKHIHVLNRFLNQKDRFHNVPVSSGNQI